MKFLFVGFLLVSVAIQKHRGEPTVSDEFMVLPLTLPYSQMNRTLGVTLGVVFYPGTGGTRFLISDHYSLRRVDLVAATIEFLIGEESDVDCQQPQMLSASNDPKVCKLLRRAALDPVTGDIFVVSQAQGVLLRVDGTNGNTSIVAGTLGRVGCSGDGGLAKDALFTWIHGVSMHPVTRDLYVSDAENHAIRKIDRQTGIITTVAGTLCQAGYSGDGGPATKAKLNHPPQVEFDPKTHDMLIADYGNGVLRSVDAKTQTITTIAGILDQPMSSNGPTRILGEGVPATSTRLGPPSGVTVDPFTGDLFVTIYQPGHCIRRISHDTGIVTTVAGTPWEAGYSGDYGPALDSKFDTPQSPSANPVTGDIWIPDSMNSAIRILTRNEVGLGRQMKKC